MQTALHTIAHIKPGGKIELTDMNLPPAGSRVEVILLFELQTVSNAVRRSVLDVLADAPGHLAFDTSEQVDLPIREERDSWADCALAFGPRCELRAAKSRQHGFCDMEEKHGLKIHV